MNQILIGVILMMGLGGYFLYNQNTTLKAENQAYELRDQVQKETIEAQQKSFATQTSALNNMTARNAEIEGEMSRYLDIFRRHNLNKLALAKPGLIETRVNNGTKDVFDSIESDSKELDSLDNVNGSTDPD